MGGVSRRFVLTIPLLLGLCPHYPPIIIRTKSGWVFDYANRLILVGDPRQEFFSALQRELRV